jgi:hypothetical protein
MKLKVIEVIEKGKTKKVVVEGKKGPWAFKLNSKKAVEPGQMIEFKPEKINGEWIIEDFQIVESQAAKQGLTEKDLTVLAVALTKSMIEKNEKTELKEIVEAYKFIYSELKEFHNREK